MNALNVDPNDTLEGSLQEVFPVPNGVEFENDSIEARMAFRQFSEELAKVSDEEIDRFADRLVPIQIPV